MLGDQIGEGRGKRTARRVLSTQPQLKVEVSFEDTAKLLGVEGVYIGTYVSMTRPDGSLDAEGQGVFAAPDGDIVTWKGIGTGRFGAAGAVSYRGCLTYNTASPELSRLKHNRGHFRVRSRRQRKHVFQNLGVEVDAG